MNWAIEYLLPLAGAVAAGGLIGFEREYRGRPAGVRTHILLCLASALLMLAAVHQVRWMAGTPDDIIRIDPVRMAHGVLTGIGFLCGGVIFKEGFSVRGLTSAASLWTTAALGVLYGISFFSLAIGGTLVTLFVLVGFRLLEIRLPQYRHIDLTIRYSASDFATESELVAWLARYGLRPDVITHRLLADHGGVEFAATFRRRGPVPGEAIAADLCADPRVMAFELSPRHE
ncbi:magnesium transporter [Phenylobacterium sp. Root77]|jgi:putative Mg2+ transporter-C (MgtC) family protein|uniref:MgtC/SapB family protein n=1 Tax=unclassified Phenylobacterium TaxID=2640670 RepID=UPI0007005109|nr:MULTISPECIES: MgtC/SapB family protein [unclassified Phenylobacterium]KQW70879.1 magnesium transporter [Phenylobacterium sp. Root1277]KQW90700.1 magnesium transporter [Phenylobacterium sp. Root1290]KRC39668.1 magnesium transporter [Phenylobacterium sp. Root77]